MLARKNLNKPPPDAATEVNMGRGGSLLPVDDETNFGDSGKAQELDEALLNVDPRALARRLAKKTRARREQKYASPPKAALPEDQPTTMGPAREAPVAPKRPRTKKTSPIEPTPSESPAALARRLAAEAKARLASTASPAPVREEPESAASPNVESPADMARRLAAEAKARLAAQTPDAPSPAPQPAPVVAEPPAAVPEPEPSPLQEAPAPEPVSQETVETAAPAPERSATKKRSLADRAPRRKSKRTAAEAMAALAAATEARTATPAPSPVVSKPIEPQQVVADVDATPMASATAALLALLPTSVALSEQLVTKPTVFRALWEAHRARAIQGGHLSLVASSCVLLDALDAGVSMTAVRLHHAGTDWAAFLRTEDGAVLSIVENPDIYLAGVS